MALKKFIVDLSRKLRRNETPEEKCLWKFPRNRRLNGLKFLRQHPIVYGGTEEKPEFFIVDFYCAEKKLVVEIDGEIHDSQKDYDRRRDEILEQLGMHVLRSKNRDLTNLATVLESIRTHPCPLSTK